MPSKIPAKKRKIDQNVESTYKDFRSKFALVTKMRANIWLITAIVLFIFGLISGSAILVDPNSVFSGNIRGMFGFAGFIPSYSSTQYNYNGATVPTLSLPNYGYQNSTQEESDNNTNCVRSPARVTATPTTTPTLANGESVTYVVTIQNRDTAGCGPAAFVLGHAPTGGYSLRFNFYEYDFAHIIEPGDSATAEIRVSPYDMPAVSNLSYLFTTHHSINTSTQSRYLDCNLIGNNTINGGPQTTNKLTITGGPSVGTRSKVVRTTGCSTNLSDPGDYDSGNDDDTGDDTGDNDGDGTTPPGANYVNLTAAADPDDQYTSSITLTPNGPFGYKWESNMTKCRIDGEPNNQLAPSGEGVHAPIHPSTNFIIICSKEGTPNVQDSVTINYSAAAKTAESNFRSGQTITQTFSKEIESIYNTIVESLRNIGFKFR